MQRYFNGICVCMFLLFSIVSCTSGQVRKMGSSAPASGRVYAGMTRLEAEKIMGQPVIVREINNRLYRGLYRYEEDIGFRTTLATDLLSISTAGLSSLAVSPVDTFSGPEHFALVLFQRNDANELNDTAISVTYRFEKSIEAMTLQDKSMLNIKDGKWEEAIRNATMAIDMDPGLDEAYMGRAVAYYEQGQYSNTIEDCSKVLDIEPDNAYAFYYRGMAYEKEGLLKEAKNDYNEACGLNLNNACEEFLTLNE